MCCICVVRETERNKQSERQREYWNQRLENWTEIKRCAADRKQWKQLRDKIEPQHLSGINIFCKQEILHTQKRKVNGNKYN